MEILFLLCYAAGELMCCFQRNCLKRVAWPVKFFCFLKIRFVRPKTLWLKISRPPVCDRLFTCCIWTTGEYVSTGDTFTHRRFLHREYERIPAIFSEEPAYPADAAYIRIPASATYFCSSHIQLFRHF